MDPTAATCVWCAGTDDVKPCELCGQPACNDCRDGLGICETCTQEDLEGD